MNSPEIDSTDSARHLMLQYLDGTLEAAAVAELSERLKTDPVFRREAAHLLLLEVQLREIMHEEHAVARVSQQPFESQKWGAPGLGWFPPIWRAFQYRFRWALGLGITSAVACLLIFSSYSPASSALRLKSVEGTVTLVRGGRQSSAAAGVRLQRGDWLSLQSNASASVPHPREGTSFRLSDSAEVRIDSSKDGKSFHLRSGSLSAVVAPQGSNSPMRLSTPKATATVFGTEFVLASGREATRLEVWSGKVRLTRTADGAWTDVEKGEFALVRNGGPLASATLRHGLVREDRLGVEESDVRDLAELQCFGDAPSGSGYLPDFESPRDWGDAYVARVRGFLRPGVSGEYRFWIVGDDRAELWLSSDESRNRKAKICWTEDWTEPHDWDKGRSQQSAPIRLEAARKYYIEAVQQEGAGADCLAVAWRVPGSSRQIIPGEYLTPPPIEEVPNSDPEDRQTTPR